MKLNHIALNINKEKDLVNFYQDILGLQLEYQYKLSPELSMNFFEIDGVHSAYMYKKDNVFFELFVYPGNVKPGVAHVCLEIPNRERLITLCMKNGYKVKIIKRENKADLLFIKDNSGNSFEIKE